MSRMNKAGLIPYYFDEDAQAFKYLMMVSSNAKFGGSKPMISKGGQDPVNEHGEQETIVDCAIREAVEELGLVEENLFEKFYLMSKSYDTYDLYVFAGEVKDPLNFTKPCYETSHTIWMTSAEFAAKGRKDHQEFIFNLDLDLRSGREGDR